MFDLTSYWMSIENEYLTQVKRTDSDKWATFSAQKNRALREHLATLSAGSRQHRMVALGFLFWSELAAHLRGEVDPKRLERVGIIRAILSGEEDIDDTNIYDRIAVPAGGGYSAPGPI